MEQEQRLRQTRLQHVRPQQTTAMAATMMVREPVALRHERALMTTCILSEFCSIAVYLQRIASSPKLSHTELLDYERLTPTIVKAFSSLFTLKAAWTAGWADPVIPTHDPDRAAPSSGAGIGPGTSAAVSSRHHTSGRSTSGLECSQRQLRTCNPQPADIEVSGRAAADDGGHTPLQPTPLGDVAFEGSHVLEVFGLGGSDSTAGLEAAIENADRGRLPAVFRSATNADHLVA